MSLRSLGMSSLDFKVGLRMLARSPGITIAGAAAIAVAIALGAVYFEAVDKYQNPRLPIPGGDRVVSILQWDVSALDVEERILYDFAAWRTRLRTVEQLGAAISFERNLVTESGAVEPVRGAEVTASAFSLMGTQPLMGRTLSPEDEQPVEPQVVVISHALWQSRFDGDPDVVGRRIELGGEGATIVGVMPEGFGFPVNQRIWAPLRTDGATLAPRTGPRISVFGRLLPDRSFDDARAELALVGAQLSAASPATHEHLRPRVTPYEKPLAEGGEGRLLRGILYAVNSVFLMVLLIMCANVATLVFARTATRSWELTVRGALGASRGRIVGQLFAEALVLTSLAAVVGLFLASVALGVGLETIGGGEALPFWIDAGISWRTVLYAGSLTFFGAAVVGILPALRVTRASIQDALRAESAGRSGLRFGGFWTTVIVAQVAITVAVLPLAGAGLFEANRFSQRAAGIDAERFLAADVALDHEDYGLDAATYHVRARSAFAELESRLAAEPGVEGVAFADRLPVEDQFKYRIEVDTAFGAPADGLRSSTLVHVSGGFFHAFDTEVVTGRGFEPLDFEAGNAMVVNQSFARNVFGGQSAIGQRVRIVSGEIDAAAGDTWYEIVGVVRDFGWQLPRPEEQSAMYLPSLPGVGPAEQVAVRVRDPATFGPRLRRVAVEVDPRLRLVDLEPLGGVGGGEADMSWALAAVAWLVLSIVLLLSAMGIHALMSFTVTRRTREIGIRTALGADRGRIVAEVFARAFVQVGAGIVVGSGLAALLGVESARQALLLLGADALMLAVGLAACVLPVRRALRIEATEALRTEG